MLVHFSHISGFFHDDHFSLILTLLSALAHHSLLSEASGVVFTPDSSGTVLYPQCFPPPGAVGTVGLPLTSSPWPFLFPCCAHVTFSPCNSQHCSLSMAHHHKSLLCRPSVHRNRHSDYSPPRSRLHPHRSRPPGHTLLDRK